MSWRWHRAGRFLRPRGRIVSPLHTFREISAQSRVTCYALCELPRFQKLRRSKPCGSLHFGKLAQRMQTGASAKHGFDTRPLGNARQSKSAAIDSEPNSKEARAAPQEPSVVVALQGRSRVGSQCT